VPPPPPPPPPPPVPAAGLRVSIENANKSMLATCLLKGDLFSQFQVAQTRGERTEVRFKANIAHVLDCLVIYGKDALPLTSLHMSYDEADGCVRASALRRCSCVRARLRPGARRRTCRAPLAAAQQHAPPPRNAPPPAAFTRRQLKMLLEESGVTTECALATQDFASGDSDLDTDKDYDAAFKCVRARAQGLGPSSCALAAAPAPCDACEQSPPTPLPRAPLRLALSRRAEGIPSSASSS